MNAGQNEQVQILATFALRGGTYKWNQTPISDAESEPQKWYSPISARVDPIFAHTSGPGFQIINPEEAFRRESLAAAQRRDSLLLVEPNLPLESWESNAPRNALVGQRIL